MSGICVDHNGLSWPKYIISQDGNDLVGPEPTKSEYPAFVIFRELASLGKAGIPESIATITSEDFYAYSDTGEQNIPRLFNDLGLQYIYNGPIFIETSGPIGVPDFNLRLLFPEANTQLGPYGDRRLEWQGIQIIQRNGREVYSCSPSLYYLAKEISLFNAKSKEDRAQETVLLDIARVKRLAEKAGAICDPILQSEHVIEPGRIRLDIVERDDSVSVIPEMELPDLPVGSFGNKFEKRISVSGVMNFDTDEGRLRVVLPEKHKKALTRIKGEMQSIKNPEKLRAILDNPPSEFDDIDIDVSALYSERVKGLGIYRPKTWPFICPYHTEWLPGIMIDGVDGKQSLIIKDSKDLADLDAAIESASVSGQDFAEFKGERIDLETAKTVAAAARTRLGASKVDIKTIAEKLKVLIIDENIEDLEYSELSEEADLSEKLCKIINLAPEVTLKPHQDEGITRLVTLYDAHHPGAILADDMGLGKTLQALAFLEILAERPEGVLVCVISPVGLIANWMDEYNQYFPEGELVPHNLMNDIGMLAEIKNQPSRFRNGLFFVSYETMRRNQLDACAIPWDVAILDEAQKIKTPGTLVTNAAKALKARFKLAVTGTPVENTFHDLWCIADFALPGFLGSARKFANDFNPNPNSSEEEIKLKGEMLLKKLGKRFLRRIKSDVLKDLPPKWESDNPDHVQNFSGLSTARVMTGFQSKTYDGVIADYRGSKEREEVKNKQGILNVLFKLKSVCEHPLFLGDIGEIEAADRIHDSAKATALLEILDNIRDKGEKAIIFVEYRRTQRFLATIIHEHYGLNPHVINGDTPVGFDLAATTGTRLSIVRSFNRRIGFDVIVMSPVAAGVGLTVTGANHVIHFSRHWNPSKEDQATDRAYRIGQTKPVYVYYLIARHPNENVKSFDDNLASLLFAKRGLRGAVLYPSERVEIKPEDVLNAV